MKSNKWHFSTFKDAHPRTGQMGWAAQILMMPDEEVAFYHWYPNRSEAVTRLEVLKTKFNAGQIGYCSL